MSSRGHFARIMDSSEILILLSCTLAEGQKTFPLPYVYTHTAKVDDLNKHHAAAGQQAGENKMSTSNMTITNASRVDT